MSSEIRILISLLQRKIPCACINFGQPKAEREGPPFSFCLGSLFASQLIWRLTTPFVGLDLGSNRIGMRFARHVSLVPLVEA